MADALLALSKALETQERAPVLVSPPEPDGWHVTVNGRTYNSPKLRQAIEWLKAHPEHQDKGVRPLAELMTREFQISKSWVSVAKQYVEREHDNSTP